MCSPPPESSSAAARRSRCNSRSASSTSSSSSTRRLSPSPEPIRIVYPASLPPVGRSGMAAHRFQPGRPVELVDRNHVYEAWVQLPGLMRSLILRFRIRRIRGITGLQLNGRVCLSRSRGGGPTVHRPGARRLYSGGEFDMDFNFPVPVNRCVFSWYDITSSVVLFYCFKSPPNYPPQPATDYVSDWVEVRFGDNDGI